MYLYGIYLEFKFFFLERENKSRSCYIELLFVYMFSFLFCFYQQILEEQDFKEEDFGLFQIAGQRCLEEGHITQLLEIIQNEKNKVSSIFVFTFQSLFGKRIIT